MIYPDKLNKVSIYDILILEICFGLIPRILGTPEHFKKMF
jgi:hypothetical protein